MCTVTLGIRFMLVTHTRCMDVLVKTDKTRLSCTDDNGPVSDMQHFGELVQSARSAMYSKEHSTGLKEVAAQHGAFDMPALHRSLRGFL